MAEVSVRELRNAGGRVLDRVLLGEQIVITRDGQPVAELRQVPGRGVSGEELLRRWQRLPRLDAAAFRADVDEALDTDL